MFFAVVSGVTFGAWASWEYVPPRFEWPSMAFLGRSPDSVDLTLTAAAAESPGETSPILVDMAISAPAAPPAGTSDLPCGHWGISPDAMEAILAEMKRQGWRPPARGA